MATLAGANIYIDGILVGTTNSAGQLVISGLTAGTHTIEATKVGYTPDSTTFTAGVDTSISLRLTVVSYDITITVTE